MRSAVVVLAFAFASALASASWSAPGSLEPDTAFDREAGRMFAQPDRSEGASAGPVYLNGFVTVEPLVVNPNVGLVGSRFDAPVVRYRALLGLWKDCDRDGYMGSAESALQEYRAERLAVDPSVCPVDSPHNDGNWVHELLAIGMTDPCEHEPVAYQQAHCEDVGPFVENSFVMYSEGSAVWADLGAPGVAPPSSCGVAPLPRGTTASTGGLMRAADCRFGQAPAEGPDLAAPVSLFGDPASGSVGLLRSGSERPAARATDCSSATTVQDPLDVGGVAVEDPSDGRLSGPIAIPLGRRTVFADTDGDDSTPGVLEVRYADEAGVVAAAPGLSSPSTDAEGSAWDAAVGVADSLYLGAGDNAPVVQRTTPGGPVVIAAYNSDCDPSTRHAVEQAYAGDLVESDAAGFASSARSRSDVVMRFEDGYRSWHESTDPFIGASAPTDVGVLATRSLHQGPLWSALSTTSGDSLPLRRGDLAPAGARYVTFYADIGPFRDQSPGLPFAAGGIYGFEACQGATSGIVGGWQCDASRWWRDAGGADVTPRYAEGDVAMARAVGAPYDLRDVDCADGAVAQGVDVWVGTTPLSEEGPCEE